jgi:hypothetical protein
MISFFYNYLKRPKWWIRREINNFLKLSVWSEDLICFIKVISNLHNADRGLFEKSCGATKMLTNVSVIKNRF